MSAHRHQATWRGITFNHRYRDLNWATSLPNPDDPANLDPVYTNLDYYLDSFDITHVSAQDYREMRQYLEGAEPNESYEGIRAILGQGRIVATSHALLEDMTWNFNEAFSVAACRQAFHGNDPAGVGPFTFKRERGQTSVCEKVRLYCRPGAGRPVVIGRIREGLARPFAFNLIAFDPFIYSEDAHARVMTGAELTDGASISNYGNVYTKPRYEFAFSGAGSATLTLFNDYTGQSFAFDASGAVPSVVVLDVNLARMTATTWNGTSCYNRRLSGFLSDMFLQPGNNWIRVSSATNLTSLTVRHRDAFA